MLSVHNAHGKSLLQINLVESPPGLCPKGCSYHAQLLFQIGESEQLSLFLCPEESDLLARSLEESQRAFQRLAEQRAVVEDFTLKLAQVEKIRSLLQEIKSDIEKLGSD